MRLFFEGLSFDMIVKRKRGCELWLCEFVCAKASILHRALLLRVVVSINFLSLSRLQLDKIYRHDRSP